MYPPLSPSSQTYCGHVAIIGRSNVGKSTALNQLIGRKISITSRKLQTTVHCVIGVHTQGCHQIIYTDTPGIQEAPVGVMNRYMNKVAMNAIEGIDLLVYMIEALKWTRLDEAIFDLIRDRAAQVIVAMNKVDQVKNKDALLPYMAMLAEKLQANAIIPISARSKKKLLPLERRIKDLLPPSVFHYPETQITDRSERHFAAEFIREQLIKRLGKELPYSTTVMIDTLIEKNGVMHIDAIIWVAGKGQKAIVIGERGSGLKAIGEAARKDMQRLFGRRVFLRTWVKMKAQWHNDELAMRQLGFDV